MASCRSRPGLYIHFPFQLGLPLLPYIKVLYQRAGAALLSRTNQELEAYLALIEGAFSSSTSWGDAHPMPR
jgi:hypothetical protein